MTAEHILFAQIEARRIELGLSQAQLGQKAFGSASSAAIQNLKRGSDPRYQNLKSLADALDFELYFGPRRETADISTVALDGDEYAHIPLHEAMLAAGPGYHNAGEAIVDHLAFRRDWLTRMNVTISAARLARVRGDSNQPTLWDGDMVLIDTSKRDPAIRRKGASDQRRSPFYALIDSGEARVKRIERPSPDVMMLISDNPDFPPELRHGDQLTDITITGRVIWSGHSFKDL